jgi:hypothetical protein
VMTLETAGCQRGGSRDNVGLGWLLVYLAIAPEMPRVECIPRTASRKAEMDSLSPSNTSTPGFPVYICSALDGLNLHGGTWKLL